MLWFCVDLSQLRRLHRLQHVIMFLFIISQVLRTAVEHPRIFYVKMTPLICFNMHSVMFGTLWHCVDNLNVTLSKSNSAHILANSAPMIYNIYRCANLVWSSSRPTQYLDGVLYI